MSHIHGIEQFARHGVVGRQQVLEASGLVSAWRKQKTMYRWLKWALGKLTRTRPRGVDVLAALLGSAGRSESKVKSEVLRIIRRVGLPEPQQQLTLHDAAGRVMRVDNAWPSHRLVLHVDSTTFHSDVAALARDARQRNRLQAIGWRQFVVLKRTLDDRAWVQQLASILRGPPNPADQTAPNAASLAAKREGGRTSPHLKT